MRIESMMGTSARPFSVSAYSTRGGTSGKVGVHDALLLERPQPQAQRARRDPGQGALQLAESRAALRQVTDHESVHFPQTMSAVRQTGQSGFGTKPKDIARLHELKCVSANLDVPLLGAAHHRERQRRRRRRRARRTGRPCSPAAGHRRATSRSPRCRPAPRPGCRRHARTSRPSRSGSPTAARMRARRAGGRARRRAAAGRPPRRSRAPRSGAGARRRRGARG